MCPEMEDVDALIDKTTWPQSIMKLLAAADGWISRVTSKEKDLTAFAAVSKPKGIGPAGRVAIIMDALVSGRAIQVKPHKFKPWRIALGMGTIVDCTHSDVDTNPSVIKRHHLFDFLEHLGHSELVDRIVGDDQKLHARGGQPHPAARAPAAAAPRTTRAHSASASLSHESGRVGAWLMRPVARAEGYGFMRPGMSEVSEEGQRHRSRSRSPTERRNGLRGLHLPASQEAREARAPEKGSEKAQATVATVSRRSHENWRNHERLEPRKESMAQARQHHRRRFGQGPEDGIVEEDWPEEADEQYGDAQEEPLEDVA